MAFGLSFSVCLTITNRLDFVQESLWYGVHTPFVDGFIAKNYPGKENEIFEQLSKSQPIGCMGSTQEIAALALYLCSDEASFITGNDYPIDGGFIKLNT